ncbi:hypothetical protein HZ326_23103 [Fusarium oxysporum f. sp. albedinis]|nr:hypothetical protein HZ326_23103 [Fusarium oxysporum f. sp. albedinis]
MFMEGPCSHPKSHNLNPVEAAAFPANIAVPSVTASCLFPKLLVETRIPSRYKDCRCNHCSYIHAAASLNCWAMPLSSSYITKLRVNVKNSTAIATSGARINSSSLTQPYQQTI